MSLKFDNFLKPFCGQQDDLEAFWAKFEVTAKLQKWDTGAVKMANFPLFLAGEAFTVWSELSDADMKDPEKVKAALSAAFSLTPAQACSALVSRTLGGGESVDGYTADLKRLLVVSGQTVASDGKIESLLNSLLLVYPEIMQGSCE